MKKGIALFLSLALMVSGLAGCGQSNSSSASASGSGSQSQAQSSASQSGDSQGEQGEFPAGDWVIGLSNSYYGNTWRKQMVDSFTKVAEEAKAAGYIKDYQIQNGDGSVNAQIEQINGFILAGVDAICINAASSTALNSVINKAVQAGIPVIAFDSTVENENAYCMDFDFANLGYQCGSYMAEQCNGEGNVVVVRGVSGSAPDELAYQGYEKVLEENPGLNVVATVLGEADAMVAQEEFTKIIPSLDKVDMIFNQGGDTYGIIQAYEQAGLEVPLMAGDNSAEFIQWWMEHPDYDTLSMRAAPACGSAAFWTALNVLNGEDVPKKMDLALSLITAENRADFANLEAGTIAGADWTNEQVVEQIIVPSREK